MINIFIDSDVILDQLLKRVPFYVDSNEIFLALENGHISGSTSPLIYANLHYLLQKKVGKQKSLLVLEKLQKLLRLTSIDGNTISQVFQDKPINDFEDMIQWYSAYEFGASYLITRNKKDYPKREELKVLTPRDFLAYHYNKRN